MASLQLSPPAPRTQGGKAIGNSKKSGSGKRDGLIVSLDFIV